MKLICILVIALSVCSIEAQDRPASNYQPSNELQEIVGSTDTSGMRQRLRKVHKLSKNLQKEEIDYLWTFLNKKHSDDQLDVNSLNPIKNDVAIVLLDQLDLPLNYADKMMGMFNAKENDGKFRHDIVWRDYCIQFLGQWLGVCHIEENRTEVIDFLYKTMDSNKGTSIPGSALIALNLNKNRLTPDQIKLLAEKATEVASTPSYGELARMSAFHIAAENSRDLSKTRVELIRALKSCITTPNSACLKMSAIAALGTIGEVDKDIQAIVNKYTKSRDVRLRKAAYGAKKKLKL